MGVEPMTSSLPRKRSTTELHQPSSRPQPPNRAARGAPTENKHPGAGDGNRTHTTSLEGWGSTFELRPRRLSFVRPRPAPAGRRLVGRAGFEPAKAEPPDLQSGPFGRSGICPCLCYRGPVAAGPAEARQASTQTPVNPLVKGPFAGASGENRTHNHPLTRRELCR